MEKCMNNQEFFDRTLFHLREQGHRAVKPVPLKNGATMCSYRGEGKDRCAIGHMFPDHMYFYGMEGNSITTLVQAYTELRNWFRYVDTSLMQEIQRAHDGARDQYYFADVEYSFYKIAQRYGLKYEGLGERAHIDAHDMDTGAYKAWIGVEVNAPKLIGYDEVSYFGPEAEAVMKVKMPNYFYPPKVKLPKPQAVKDLCLSFV